jgi:hypothetical protein
MWARHLQCYRWDVELPTPWDSCNQHGEPIMPEHIWGLCKDCKWWRIEPDAAIENLTLGLCIEEKLQPYVLRVSGHSGCNRFLPGKPARAEGSGEAPPKAKPMR